MHEGFRELREAVAELALGQARVERAIGELRSEVGGLSQSLGFWIEDTMAVDLPPWLESRYGIVPPGELATAFLTDPSGVEHEFDGYAQAVVPEGNLVLLCEAKTRLYERDVRELAAKRERLSGVLPAPARAVIVGQWVHPRARAAGADLDVLVASLRDLRR